MSSHFQARVYECMAAVEDVIASDFGTDDLETVWDCTEGEIRSRMRKLAIEADPEQAEERFVSKHEERMLTSQATDEGTANLYGLDLHPDQVVAATDRINRIAHRLKTKDEPRTMDQLRADVFIDLLLGNQIQSADPRKGVIELRVGLDTWPAFQKPPGSWEETDRSSLTSPERSPKERPRPNGVT